MIKMNDLLQLTNLWHERSGKAFPNFPTLKSNKRVTTQHLANLISELLNLQKFWISQQNLVDGAIISVYYDRVVAKSNRMKQIFRKNTAHDPNEYVVAARYIGTGSNIKHVITYYVPFSVLENTISDLEKAKNVITNNFKGVIINKDLENIKNNSDLKSITPSAIKSFAQIIVDSSFIEKFDNYKERIETDQPRIVSLYDLRNGSTSIDDSISLLKKLGIRKNYNDFLDQLTVLLNRNDLKKINEKGSYLVYMATKDAFSLGNTYSSPVSQETFSPLPSPTNEPTIGVLDTYYEVNDYFKDWVEPHNMVTTKDPKYHGNKVTSIIVDGPEYNPSLQDDCGLFKVRHFGIAEYNRNSSFTIMQRIKKIVKQNPDIHVWNLSLGSPISTSKNVISETAAFLDKLQTENKNILFIISGTNLDDGKNKKDDKYNRIGSPADSINSIVVNSVTINNQVTDYARKGPVLRYFVKPDVAYYGGSDEYLIKTATPLGESQVEGTSFAAPWIARKASFLIDKLHLSREIAKALIIDSAAGWLQNNHDPKYLGYGIVPKKIEDVIDGQKDEIRFTVTGRNKKYESYTDGIPIPQVKGKFPFIARATLVYFPSCTRNQGVDYTDTELSLQFGRLPGVSTTKINSLKNDNEIDKYVTEGQARIRDDKWDNVKLIGERYTNKRRAKNVIGKGFWGIKLRSTERLNNKAKIPFDFAVVLTFKNLDGMNLIEDFKQMCLYNNIHVTDINIQNIIESNAEANTNITFDKDDNPEF